ncbi:transposase [Bradyrhizobium sp. CIR3A]|uniref:transposase n=1 Tax=Bradyrhizobium sp. CIR3A TaxID=2663838 RepID=UPI001606208D|nr:transposase [Bradyrhizobium sp. CIR3A]MBB4263890.1 transposase [Bradyrhizobium sp. CIR3A]
MARQPQFTTEKKLLVVNETLQPGMSVSFVARRSRRLEEWVRDLEVLLGRKSMDVEMLKELLILRR